MTDGGTNEDEEQSPLMRLPAELRNQIYEHLAWNTTLILSPVSPKKRPPPVGLLLACRQTRAEYRDILMTNAAFMLIVANYNFSVVIRTFERLSDHDLSLLHKNPRLLVYLQIAHVPSRDDKNLLKAWRDYRGDAVIKPYFTAGRRLPRDLVFEYDVMFLHHMRPPRPIIRYTNGYEMRLDLLRTHLRMAQRMQALEPDVQSHELQKIQEDLKEREKLLKDLAEGRGSISALPVDPPVLTNEQSIEEDAEVAQ